MKATVILACIAVAVKPFLPVPAFPPPPGTKKIGDNRYIDEQLVTYTDYHEFLYDLKNRDTALYRQMLPEDTSITYAGNVLWNNDLFSEYPVLGLNENQISRYCSWRSDAVNFMIFNPDRRCGNFKYWAKFDAADPARQYKVVYSLPTQDDISASSLKKEKYHPDEFAADGSVPGKKSDKISDASWKGFRCKATYVPAN